MITFQTLRDNSKNKMLFSQCDKICLICGYHTHEANQANQQIHEYCMNQYSKFCQELYKVKGCSMCGSKTRKLVLDSNTCSQCLDEAF